MSEREDGGMGRERGRAHAPCRGQPPIPLRWWRKSGVHEFVVVDLVERRTLQVRAAEEMGGGHNVGR